MRRWLVAVCVAAAGLFTPHKMSAQFAVVDAGNLAQAVLSFLQDGDNMIIIGGTTSGKRGENNTIRLEKVSKNK